LVGSDEKQVWDLADSKSQVTATTLATKHRKIRYLGHMPRHQKQQTEEKKKGSGTAGPSILQRV